MITYPTRCQWPGCSVAMPLVMWGEAEEWLCLDHVTDDFLPPTWTGVIDVCVHCGKATPCFITEADRGLTWIHPACLRAWTKLQNASVTELPEKVTLGAYGRRQTKKAK